MLTSERVEEIIAEHEDEHCQNESDNDFLEGLNLMHSRSKEKHSGKYGADHDVFYAESLEDMPDLTEEDVIKLNRLGFTFEDGGFQTFV